METDKTAKAVGADKLYRQRAQAALPLLVRQAHAGKTIPYSALAEELGMPNPRNLNYVLGSVGSSLEELSARWGTKVPPIQCLVVNKATGLPGEGIGWFFPEKAEFKKLPLLRQRELVEIQLQNIFLYPEWDKVLAELGLAPVKTDFNALMERTASFRAGGECEAHKRLKEYVAKRPDIIGLPLSAGRGETEHLLPAGDKPDVSFHHKDTWIAAEVKSAISSVEDITRGIFQCVKYRAVMEASLTAQFRPANARAVLVMEGKLTTDLRTLKNMLGVEVIENISPEEEGAAALLTEAISVNTPN